MTARQEILDELNLPDDARLVGLLGRLWPQKRIKDAGWRIVFLPQAEFIHHEGKSSEQVVPQRHIRFQRSKIRYFRKHHGRFQAACLRLFLLVTYAVQLLDEGAKWLMGHKRPLRGERVAAYWQVLKALAH